MCVFDLCRVPTCTNTPSASVSNLLCESALNKHARLKHAPGMFSQIHSVQSCTVYALCPQRMLCLDALGCPSESCRYTGDSFRLVEE